ERDACSRTGVEQEDRRVRKVVSAARLRSCSVEPRLHTQLYDRTTPIQNRRTHRQRNQTSPRAPKFKKKKKNTKQTGPDASAFCNQPKSRPHRGESSQCRECRETVRKCSTKCSVPPARSRDRVSVTRVAACVRSMSGLLQKVVPLSRRMFGGTGRVPVRSWLLFTLLLTSAPRQLQSTADAEDRGLHKR
uniref:Uncharacterized protein n=1 Tax=Anopheles atroparvus TaxID=41427 RepID=A0AAG5DW26_ANOAO